MMATNVRPMPLLVIDTCPSNENQSKKIKSKKVIPKPTRSWSLTNCSETYKDLQGAIHQSVSLRFDQVLYRSRSYPNNSLAICWKANEKHYLLQSPSTSTNINCLDPNSAFLGSQTPGGSSSRYSLYGSVFNVSESGYCPSSDQSHHKSDNKLLTLGGRPLLIIDQPHRFAPNTFQDKCIDWLRQIQTNTN